MRLTCKQFDSFLRKDFGGKLAKVADVRIAASAGVSAVRFDLLVRGRPYAKVDVQGGHLGSGPDLEAPPTSTLGATSKLVLHELITSEYCGGFAGGNGPIDSFAGHCAEFGLSQHPWKTSMLSLLNEGVSGSQLRMNDITASQKYRPQLIIGGNISQTLFLSEQGGSSITGPSGKLINARYLWGGAMAALLLGGRADDLQEWSKEQCPFAIAFIDEAGAAALTKRLNVPKRVAFFAPCQVGGEHDVPCATVASPASVPHHHTDPPCHRLEDQCGVQGLQAG